MVSYDGIGSGRMVQFRTDSLILMKIKRNTRRRFGQTALHSGNTAHINVSARIFGNRANEVPFSIQGNSFPDKLEDANWSGRELV